MKTQQKERRLLFCRWKWAAVLLVTKSMSTTVSSIDTTDTVRHSTTVRGYLLTNQIQTYIVEQAGKSAQNSETIRTLQAFNSIG